jgi:hypothetical protein
MTEKKIETVRVTVELPAVVQIPVGKKHMVKVHVNRLKPEVLVGLWPMGLQRILGDTAAGKKGDEAIEAVNKKLESLYAGDLRSRKPAADPVLVRMREIARTINGMKAVDAATADWDKLRTMFGADRFEKLLALARKQVEDAKALATL